MKKMQRLWRGIYETLLKDCCGCFIHELKQKSNGRRCRTRVSESRICNLTVKSPGDLWQSAPVQWYPAPRASLKPNFKAVHGKCLQVGFDWTSRTAIIHARERSGVRGDGRRAGGSLGACPCASSCMELPSQHFSCIENASAPMPKSQGHMSLVL